MTRAVFFDLDGTLTDPKVGITQCIQHALTQLGADVPPADQLEWCIGPPLLESFETLVGNALAAEAVALYRERFADVGWSENVPYPGIKEMLASLFAGNVPLYVATSKPHVFAARILDHFELAPYFDALFGAELDGTRADKTALLKHALTQTGANRDSVMVGDRRHDVAGALANGLHTVGVTYGYGTTEELADAGAGQIVATPTALARLLRTICVQSP